MKQMMKQNSLNLSTRSAVNMLAGVTSQNLLAMVSSLDFPEMAGRLKSFRNKWAFSKYIHDWAGELQSNSMSESTLRAKHAKFVSQFGNGAANAAVRAAMDRYFQDTLCPNIERVRASEAQLQREILSEMEVRFWYQYRNNIGLVTEKELKRRYTSLVNYLVSLVPRAFGVHDSPEVLQQELKRSIDSSFAKEYPMLARCTIEQLVGDAKTIYRAEMERYLLNLDSFQTLHQHASKSSLAATRRKVNSCGGKSHHQVANEVEKVIKAEKGQFATHFLAAHKKRLLESYNEARRQYETNQAGYGRLKRKKFVEHLADAKQKILSLEMRNLQSVSENLKALRKELNNC
jgi:ribosomal protein L44E